MEEITFVLQALANVQRNLHAPKGQRNNFGNYNYRSCEDILEAAKPILAQVGATIVITDQVEKIGDRYYVHATATFTHMESNQYVQVSGWAREEENKKGMDGSQVTGASSSYARKYALNGLLLIDDNKDSDATNQHGKGDDGKKKVVEKPVTKPKAEKKEPPPAPVKAKDVPPPVVGPVKLDERTIMQVIASFEKLGIEVWDLEKLYGVNKDWTVADKMRMFKVYERIVSTTDSYSSKDFLEEAKKAE